MFSRTNHNNQIDAIVNEMTATVRKLVAAKEKIDASIESDKAQKREIEERITSSTNASERASRISQKLEALLE